VLARPGFLPGGMLDGFLCRPGDEDVWAEVWAEGGRGYPEMIW